MEIQWSLVFFTFLCGLSSWMFAGTALTELRGKAEDKTALISSVAVLVIMCVGGLASVTHLSHPTRIMGALGHLTSGIAVEIIMLGSTSIFVLVYAILIWRGAGPVPRKVIAAIGGVLGIIFSYAMGSSYVIAAREAWNTVLMPLAYAGTSMAAGTSTYLFYLSLRNQEGEIPFAGRLALCGAVVALVLDLAYGLTSGAADVTVLFWVGVVVVGALGTGVFAFLAQRKPATARAFTMCALAAAVVGSISYRVLMWTVGTGYYVFFGMLQ